MPTDETVIDWREASDQLAQRVTAALADLDALIELHTGPHACHTWHEAHREMDAYCTVHEGDICTTHDRLTRIRRTLTGEDTDHDR